MHCPSDGLGCRWDTGVIEKDAVQEGKRYLVCVYLSCTKKGPHVVN